MKLITTLMAAGAVVVAAGSAQAAPIAYSATSYAPDGHSIWLKGGIVQDDGTQALGSDFHFNPAGEFDLDDKLFARLRGTVESEVGGDNNGFEVAFDYNTNLAAGAQYKPESGAATAPGDLTLMNMVGGTLTGFGDILGGLVFDVSRMPADGYYATQIGTGANGKSAVDFGMANWFFLDCRGSCTNSAGASFFTPAQGDVNVNLELDPNRVPAPIPLPAAGWMLLAGLGGLAAMKRRKAA